MKKYKAYIFIVAILLLIIIGIFIGYNIIKNNQKEKEIENKYELVINQCISNNEIYDCDLSIKTILNNNNFEITASEDMFVFKYNNKIINKYKYPEKTDIKIDSIYTSDDIVLVFYKLSKENYTTGILIFNLEGKVLSDISILDNTYNDMYINDEEENYVFINKNKKLIINAKRKITDYCKLDKSQIVEAKYIVNYTGNSVSLNKYSDTNVEKYLLNNKIECK